MSRVLLEESLNLLYRLKEWPDYERCSRLKDALEAELDKLDTSVPSIINWIPNTGVRPECKVVLIRFSDGVIANRTEPKNYYWDNDVIKEYAIIE